MLRNEPPWLTRLSARLVSLILDLSISFVRLRVTSSVPKRFETRCYRQVDSGQPFSELSSGHRLSCPPNFLPDTLSRLLWRDPSDSAMNSWHSSPADTSPDTTQTHFLLCCKPRSRLEGNFPPALSTGGHHPRKRLRTTYCDLRNSACWR